MKITLRPTDWERRRIIAIRWLEQVLDTPTLSGAYPFPSSLTGYVWVSDQPYTLRSGAWCISEGCIRLPGDSTDVDPFSRLGVLACVANITHAINEPRIVEKLSAKLTVCISESIRSVYEGLIHTVVKPSRIAIDQVGCRVAAEINGGWFLPQGTPVEVTDSWITMDF